MKLLVLSEITADSTSESENSEEDVSRRPLDFTFISKVKSYFSSKQKNVPFILQALNELLKARKVLSSSYAYGYFLKDCGYNRTIFEYLQVGDNFKLRTKTKKKSTATNFQNELEVSVETLSSLVGRQYLRGSRQKIISTTAAVANRRQRFLLCIQRLTS